MRAVQIDDNITYPQKWTSLEFTCKRCGTKCRVDACIEVASGLQSYQHCVDDEDRPLLPGSIIAVWEERKGTWVLVRSYL